MFRLFAWNALSREYLQKTGLFWGCKRRRFPRNLFSDNFLFHFPFFIKTIQVILTFLRIFRMVWKLQFWYLNTTLRTSVVLEGSHLNSECLERLIFSFPSRLGVKISNFWVLIVYSNSTGKLNKRRKVLPSGPHSRLITLRMPTPA